VPMRREKDASSIPAHGGQGDVTRREALRILGTGTVGAGLSSALRAGKRGAPGRPLPQSPGAVSVPPGPGPLQSPSLRALPGLAQSHASDSRPEQSHAGTNLRLPSLHLRRPAFRDHAGHESDSGSFQPRVRMGRSRQGPGVQPGAGSRCAASIRRPGCSPMPTPPPIPWRRGMA